MGNAEEPPVNTESIFAFETYDHAIYFYLNPIYVLKSITMFLFYLEIMVTGAITVFEKMWRMIN